MPEQSVVLSARSSADDDKYECELALVGELRRERLTQREIAARTGLRLETVNLLLQENRRRWIDTQNESTDALIREMIADALHVERLAYAEFHRSRLNKIGRKIKKKIVPVDANGGGLAVETSKERHTEGRIGEAKFLAVIQKSQEMRAKLLGLLKPEPPEHAKTTNQIITIIEYPELPPRELPSVVASTPATVGDEVSYPLPVKGSA